MEVRISGIMDLAMARAANGLGPDYIGLQIATRGNEGISPIQVPDLVKWLPQAQLVAQTHLVDADKALRLAELLQLGYAEVLQGAAQVFSPKLWVWCAEPAMWNNRANWVAAAPTWQNAQAYTNAWVSLGPDQEGRLGKWIEAGITRFDFHAQAFSSAEGLDWPRLDRMIQVLREC